MMIFNSAKTNTGVVRTENQDCFGVKQESDFFFVCDGMGGGVAGDFASKCAVDVILSLYDKLTKQDCLDVIGQEFEKYDEAIIKPIALIKIANRQLNNLTKKYPKLTGMGTTCAGVWFDRTTNLVHIYNVGDSRVYRIRNGNIQLLTEDHSKIKELIDSGKMTQEDAKMAEIQSMITRALGIKETVKVDYKSEFIKNGDIYVLCTDGLNGELSDFTINDIVSLNKPDVETISNELIQSANNAGGRDNTTVISVCVQNDSFDVIDNDDITCQKEILICDAEKSEQSSKEDSLIRNFEKTFTVPVPKLATKKNLLKSPIFIAIILVLFLILSVSLYTALFNTKGEQKSIVELTGNVSGISLDIRTLPKEKIEEIINTEDKVFRMQILQECLLDYASLTPMPNVTISITLGDQNKFMGVSSYKPSEIKLPRGTYLLTLSYPDYKILDGNLNLKDSMEIYLESSENLSSLSVIMVPEKDFTGI
ncbi:MAG: protein phosphatase 2C domain-containing protein [Endomicrobiaceae bacterium]|nr:protein phosphatase 2C domain-containing protein [Endomicrobiaceae bacterium]